MKWAEPMLFLSTYTSTQFNFFGDINFSLMECLIFSVLITTSVPVFSKLSANPMLAMIMLAM